MRQSPENFLDTLVNELEPVKPLKQRDGMTWVFICLSTASLFVGTILGLRHDLLTMRPDPIFLLSTGLFFVLALASGWAAVAMARPSVGSRRDGFGWTALMAAVLPAAALCLIITDLVRGQPITLDHDGILCLIIGCAIGLLTAAALILWLRRGAPSSPERAGLLTGIAAGAAGIFAVSLYCPHNDLLHIGIWHAATVMFMGLIGRLTLPKLLAW